MKIRNNTRPQPPEGVHFGRVTSVADIGKQPGFSWSGGDVEPAYKLEITYELVNTDMGDVEDEKRPFWVSEEVTNTNNDKGKLKTRVFATGASGDDLSTMLDKPVMITIVLNDKGYAKIANVAGVPQGQDVPALAKGATLFDIYDENPDLDKFNTFSDFKKDKIKGALDFDTTALSLALLKEGEDTPY